MLNVIVVSIRFILPFFSFSAVKNRSPWRMSPCDSNGRVQTRRSAAKPERSRSIILGRPTGDLAGLETALVIGRPETVNFVAPQAFQTVLVEVIPT
jgi:hypothetical protein